MPALPSATKIMVTNMQGLQHKEQQHRQTSRVGVKSRLLVLEVGQLMRLLQQL